MTETNRILALIALTGALVIVGPTTVAAKDQKDLVAAPGPCAEPRELSRSSRPKDAVSFPTITPNRTFGIAGRPADRLSPAQVAASMPIPGVGGPGVPLAPGALAVSVCDSPAGCGAQGPAFAESPAQPDPPPGLP